MVEWSLVFLKDSPDGSSLTHNKDIEIPVALEEKPPSEKMQNIQVCHIVLILLTKRHHS